MFMDSETYRICLTNALGNKFEVDLLIAKTIQLLNKKGYKTAYCCGGHAKKDLVTPVYFEDGTVCEGATMTAFYNQLYIAFDDGIKIPTIPEGFELSDFGDSIGIYHTISCNNELKNEDSFAGKKERLRILKKLIHKNFELYNWAVSLPVYNKDIETSEFTI